MRVKAKSFIWILLAVFTLSTSLTSCKMIKKIKRQRKAKKIEQKMDKLENKGLDSDTKTGLWIMGGFVVVGGAVIAIATSKNKKNDKQ